MSKKLGPSTAVIVTSLCIKNCPARFWKALRRNAPKIFPCHCSTRRRVDTEGTPFSADDTEQCMTAISSKSKNACAKTYAIVWVIVVLGIVAITFGLAYGLTTGSRAVDEEVAPRLGIGAVVSNGEGCAEIGGKILKDGGSAVDAAIATMLCESVILPHSLGLGGGFVATIYTKETGKIKTLIARETAPAAATADMFIEKNITGAISMAIPGELSGYWALHEKYGKLPWKELFEPTIDLCLNGHKVSKALADLLLQYQGRLRDEASMAEIFVNPQTNEMYKEGETMFRRRLAETLRIIADEGPDAMYRGGRVGKMLVKDIQDMGGIITEKDLQNYRVRWEEPIVARFTGGYTLYTTPLPTSGAVLAFILNVMGPLYTNSEIYWQRLIETYKHAYGHRTHLGDMHYEPEISEIFEKMVDPEYAAGIRELILDDATFMDMEYYGADFTNIVDRGTANLAVVAPNGDAISVTSTINSHFGAKVRSRSTGIILNDEMDDFCTPGVVNAFGIPASPVNYIKPGKIPMSSTCPSIVLDTHGNVRLVVGAAGGSKITTAVAQTILRYVVCNETLFDAVNGGRIHHQLAPMYVDVEPTVSDETVDYLLYVGHDVNILPEGKAFSSLTAIGLKTGEPLPVCDGRRKGSEVVVKTSL